MEAMPPSPRHWLVELWRMKRKREQEQRKQDQDDDDDNKTVIPDDLTETPTSPSDRPTTMEPKSPLPDLEEAADEDKAQEEPKEVVVTKEEESEEKEKLSEENNTSDGEIARTLADLLQSTKDSGKTNDAREASNVELP